MSDSDPKNPPPAKPRLFLSRSGQDRAIAQELIADLKALGYDVRAQDHDILTGEDFRHFMDRTLRECVATVALLSSSYLKSDWCRDEAVSAHRNANHRLIPMLIEPDCMPDGLIAAFVFLDVAEKLRSDAPGVARLVDDVLTNGKPLDDNPPAKAFTRQSHFVTNLSFDDAALLAGRDDASRALDKALASQGSAAAITALAGMGGVGKSWLARVYATRNRTKYRGVWLVRAETEAEIAEDLAALGAALDPAIAQMADRPAAARAALDLLARIPGRPILLIFDNAETPDVMRKWRPRAGVHVIVTSRWADWTGTGATAIPLDVLSREGGVELLRGLSPRTSATDAALIADRLGSLPLALTHAGAVLRRSGLTAEQYLRDLDKRLATLPPSSGEYPDAVRAALDSNLAQLAAFNADAPALLGLAAFCAPDGIPFEIWKQDAARRILPPSLHDDVALQEALGALETYSLARIDWDDRLGPTLALHRLVQQITRAQLAERNDAAATAAALVDSLMALTPEEIDFPDWPLLARLMPHAEAVLARPDDDPALAAASRTFDLMQHVGGARYTRGQFVSAERWLRRALTWLRAHTAGDSLQLAKAIRNLAIVNDNLRNPREALKLMREARDVLQQGGHADTPEMMELTVKLSGLEEAEVGVELATRALAQADAAKKPAAESALASALARANRAEEAETHYRRAVDLLRSDPPTPAYAVALREYGDHLETMGRTAEALAACTDAIAAYEASAEPNHPGLALALAVLGPKIVRAGRFEEGVAMQLRAIDLWEQAYGPHYQDISSLLYSIGHQHEKAGRLSEAIDYVKRAIALEEAAARADGLADPRRWLAVVHRYLAILLSDAGRFDEAIDPQLADLKRAETAEGPDSLAALNALSALADIYAGADRHAEAATTQKRVVALAEQLFPPGDPGVAKARVTLAAYEAGPPKGEARPPAEPTVH